MNEILVRLTVNGAAREVWVEPRMSLADVLRETLRLTGTHLGCEHGVCGACTVLLEGKAVRSCLLLAVQCQGHQITTVEGLSQNGDLSALQQSFRKHHALQCGFCTPGFLMTASAFIAERSNATEEEIREALSGNLCRCGGYENLLDAVMEAVAKNGGEKDGTSA